MARRSQRELPPVPRPVPSASVENAAAGLGEYVGAEQSASREPAGCAITLFALVGLVVGIGLLASGAWALVIAGAVVILLAVAALVVGWRRPRLPSPVVHCFERGMVLDYPSDAVTSYAWLDLVPFQWTEEMSIGQAANPYAVDRLTLQTRRGDVVATFVQDGALRVSQQVARAHVKAAEEVLSAGDEVRFGAFRLTRDNLAFNDQVLPWSAVRSVAAGGRLLVVYRHGRRRSAIRTARKVTPHERALLTLASRRVSAGDPPESG